VHDHVVEGYSNQNVDTLHKKNLLALGEDRYLTTLVLKSFPKMKTKFTPSATAYTQAPDSFAVLLSQRRRWINSTLHNLVELVRVQDLCGFCCVSMRFIVLIDLISTVIQPATVVYLVYLIYLTVRAIMNEENLNIVMVSFILLACIYGAQAVVFLLKREFAHIVWSTFFL
jgi:chitin synthase